MLSIAVSYIPNPDAQALAWLENFLTALQPRPEAFGVDPRDVASLARHIHDFRDKMAVVASSPGQAGPGSHAISNKLLARNTAVQLVQVLVRAIRAHPLTTPEDLALLGLPGNSAADDDG